MAGVLDDTQEQKLMTWFDNQAKEASSPPNPANYAGNMSGLIAAQASYSGNPLAKAIQPIIDDIKTQNLSGYNTTTGAITPNSDADVYLKAQIANLRQKFQAGIEQGKPDDGSAVQSAFQSIMNGDWWGAIKTFVLNIPLVGNLLAAGGKWLMSMFSGNKLSFGEARDQATAGNALIGGLGAVGVANDNATITQLSASINAGSDTPSAPPANPAPTAPTTGAGAGTGTQLAQGGNGQGVNLLPGTHVMPLQTPVRASLAPLSPTRH
jgi:hypothetical protein